METKPANQNNHLNSEIPTNTPLASGTNFMLACYFVFDSAIGQLMLGKSRDKYFTEWKTNNKSSLMLTTIFFNFAPRLLGAGSAQHLLTPAQTHSLVNIGWHRVRFSFLFNFNLFIFPFFWFSQFFSVFYSQLFSLLWFFAALCPACSKENSCGRRTFVDIAQAICKCVKSPCFWIGRALQEIVCLNKNLFPFT